MIRDIVEREIGNGEGANFVVPRSGRGRIAGFSVAKALTIFRSLVINDSIPEEEVLETRAKGAAVLGSVLSPGKGLSQPPLLSVLANDDEIVKTLARRNQNRSNFWFFKQESRDLTVTGREEAVRITIIHNEDDFVYMLRHMLCCMGLTVEVVRFDAYDFARDRGDITLLGPGPGNPNDRDCLKMDINRQIARNLLDAGEPSLFICLGHQLLCRQLAFEVRRKVRPLQGGGSCRSISLAGRNWWDSTIPLPRELPISIGHSNWRFCLKMTN